MNAPYRRICSAEKTSVRARHRYGGQVELWQHNINNQSPDPLLIYISPLHSPSMSEAQAVLTEDQQYALALKISKTDSRTDVGLDLMNSPQ